MQQSFKPVQSHCSCESCVADSTVIQTDNPHHFPMKYENDETPAKLLFHGHDNIFVWPCE